MKARRLGQWCNSTHWANSVSSNPSDGQEIYFHRNSVLDDDYSRLAVGSRVTYAEEMGEKGPQASTVKLMGKHSLRA